MCKIQWILFVNTVNTAKSSHRIFSTKMPRLNFWYRNTATKIPTNFFQIPTKISLPISYQNIPTNPYQNIPTKFLPKYSYQFWLPYQIFKNCFLPKYLLPKYPYQNSYQIPTNFDFPTKIFEIGGGGFDFNRRIDSVGPNLLFLEF